MRATWAILDLYKKYWAPFRSFVPSRLQRAQAELALWAAKLRPSLEVYADIIDRASRNREHFWSGAVSFWESTKHQLVVDNSVHSSAMPAELVQAGLLPPSFLEPDTFNIVTEFNARIDRECPDQDVLTRMIYNEFKLRLPELLLMRVDKIGMSTSIEARVPFLDHELVEFTMDIPMADKVRGGTAKYLLKKAVEGLIPDQIIHRKKMGFGAPMTQWMRADFGREVEASMFKSRLFDRGFFRRDFISRLFVDHRSGKRDNSLHLWTMFNLSAWYDYWIDGNFELSAAA